MFKLSQVWPVGALFSLTALSFLTFLCLSSSIYLLSGTIQCFRPSLYFPCSIPGIGQLSKDDWSLLMDNDIWKPKPEHCMYSFLLTCQCFQSFPKDRARKYKYSLISIYFYLYQYTTNCEFISLGSPVVALLQTRVTEEEAGREMSSWTSMGTMGKGQEAAHSDGQGQKSGLRGLIWRSCGGG